MRSIMKEIVAKNANETIEVLMTEVFLKFMLDEGEKRFKTVEERRASILGAAMALGFYGKEIKQYLVESMGDSK